jgi:hypothetical protein
MLPMLVPADDLTLQLAKELFAEDDHKLSAIEFRRFAMETENKTKQSGAYLYSGLSYLMAEEYIASSEMLDRAEDVDTDSTYMTERTLLRAENARLAYDADTALYFYDLLSEDASPEFQALASRRSAALHFARRDFNTARAQLRASSRDESVAVQAIETYMNGKDKNPAAGGLLGLVPGAGYWYSGEIANGFRSLILNGLFMYGMAHTADNEQWGAFTVITFFELTWYSGSIYGGMDAAQRFNKDRMDTAIHAIDGNMSYQPDLETTVPMFKLNILF